MKILISFSLFVVLLSGCKSLEKRCLAKFPASIDHNYSLIIEDKTIPESKLKAQAGPCPEWFNQLPPDGKKVIVADDEKAQILASQGKDGKIDLEAIIKAQNIKGASKSETSKTAQVMHIPCDCSDKINAAKWDLIVDILFGVSILVILAIGGYFYWRFKKGLFHV